MRVARVLIGSIVIVSVAVISIVYAVISRPRPRQETPRGGSITGRVVDSEGQPVVGALVYASRVHSPLGMLPTTVTDREGTFSFSELRFEAYTVYASKEEEGYPVYSPFYAVDPTDSTAGGMTSAMVTIYKQQPAADIVIAVGPRMAKFTGNIKDASGKPVGAEITLCRLDMPNSCVTAGSNKEEDGAFEFLAPPVPYTVEVYASGYEQKRINALPLPGGETKKLDFSLRADKH